MTPKKKVLFVCMGNICRSPAGEGLFKHYLQQKGLEGSILVDSAGTIASHVGEPPDARMQRAAAARGYTLTGAARQFKRPDFEVFDLIIAMDRANLRDIQSLDTADRFKEKVHLLCDFNPHASTRDVPDPYYGGPKGFEEVLDLIEGACDGILAKLQEQD